MSLEVVIATKETLENGIVECSNCGFSIPEDIPVCWKCGESRRK